MLNERIEGHGNLESWENPDKKLAVEYAFDIFTEVLEKPGFSPVTTRRHSRGNITSLAGGPIAEGYYRLFASDGEILKVQNLGSGHWAILAS